MKSSFIIGCIAATQFATATAYQYGGNYGYGNQQSYNSQNQYSSGYKNPYGTPYNQQQSFFTFNVPRTQTFYFHHNHKNDELYGYNDVNVQTNYDSTTNDAINTVLSTALTTANTNRITAVTGFSTAAKARLQAVHDQHNTDITAYFDAQESLLNRQVLDIQQAETYALADLQDGLDVLNDEIDQFLADKTSAFNQQHALVQSYFTRAQTDQKNQLDVLDAMNVHYISGVAVTSTTDPTTGTTTFTAADNGADLDVYEDSFDQFVFDVGHLAEDSPAFQKPVTHATPSYSQPASNSYQSNQSYSNQQTNQHQSNNYYQSAPKP